VYKSASRVLCADAKPTESELTVWNQMEGVLQQTEAILTEMRVYRGAAIEIRDVSRYILVISQCFLPVSYHLFVHYVQ